MANLTLLHARLLITILLFFGVLSIWGFVNYLRGTGITGGYRGALAIGELLLLAEFLLGAILCSVVACDGPTDADRLRPIGALEIVSGDQQSGTVGEELPDCSPGNCGT